MYLQYGISPNSMYKNAYTDYVDAANPTISYGGEILIAVGSGPTTTDWRRGLVLFSLAPVPSNAHITGAYLSAALTDDEIPTGATYTIGLHKVNCPWNEGATWNDTGLAAWGACKTAPDSSPITKGTSYDSAPLDTVSFTPASFATRPYAWNIPATIIQGWLNNPIANQGLLLASEGEGTDAAGSLAFGGRDDGVDGPILTVNFTIP
jgi:hypothetical protein